VRERESDQRWLLEVVEAMPDGVVIVDDSGSIVLVNRELERLVGYDRSALLGQRIEMLLPDDAQAAHEEHRAGYARAPRRRAMGRGLDLAARRALGRRPASSDAGCTADRPGAYLESTVLDRADDLGDAARDLAAEIRARGRVLGRVPEIVFTTYPDPLPDSATGLAVCPDGVAIGPEQLAYMHRLVDTLNGALRDALVDAPGVRVADPDPAFAGHRWCDPDPWVYGPSIFLTDPSSRAPFHPTPAGQRAIAEAVLAARAGVPGDWRGTV